MHVFGRVYYKKFNNSHHFLVDAQVDQSHGVRDDSVQQVLHVLRRQAQQLAGVVQHQQAQGGGGGCRGVRVLV